ncbi:MAG: hypothetical protein A2Z08_11325 [Deltaproteobacteria bacterium RBG_16_54_11]|jgi:hypothetical protein|nr:MAG: hypothetical protein A2Z08_11325 [Deltaproteobacteria bacterium RBG_16_54_11]
MHLYEVNFHSVVSPYRGDLIIPFREVTVRKLHKVRGKVKVEGKIRCHRLREFIASALGNTIFYTHMGPVDREKGTLSVDALITLTFILLELKEEDFFRKNSAEEFVVDQSFLDLATTSNIRLSQFAEFNHFLLRRTEKEKVPQVIAGHFHYVKNPLFYRVR